MPQHRPRLRILAFAVPVALLLALPAASETSKAPKTQVWMDVATYSMAGMPDLGGLGRFAMGAFGGSAAQNHYGATRVAAMPGRYVDIAMLNALAPGHEAEDQVPAGLQLGPSLPLLPPKAEVHGETGPSPRDARMQDSTARILVYWGCSATVRPGQPREIRIDVKDGQARVSGSMQGRYAPDRTADAGPSYALWPNERNHKPVPEGASLVGEHHITGTGVPESLKFSLDQAQDFMPAIALSSHGDLASGTTWTWQPVDRARGYFLHAMGMQGDAMVFWSSSETADAGMGVLDYLPQATIDKWTREKVLLAPTVTSCAMPAGIFAGGGGRGGRGEAAGGMLRMIAYGPERNIAWPPRPASAKAAWNPEWNVRVRAKSTTMAMLGLQVDADDAPPQQPGEKKPLKSLLRGLFGGGGG